MEANIGRVPILAHVLPAFPLAPERAGPPLFSDFTACFVSRLLCHVAQNLDTELGPAGSRPPPLLMYFCVFCPPPNFNVVYKFSRLKSRAA